MALAMAGPLSAVQLLKRHRLPARVPSVAQRCAWCCSKAPHSKTNHCSSCFKREIQSLDQEYKSNVDRSTSYLHVVRWVTLAGGCTHKHHQQLIDEVGLWAQTQKGTLRSAAYKHVSWLS